MKRIKHIFGYTNDFKDNLFLFGLQLFVITLPAYLSFVNSYAVALLFLIWLYTNDFTGIRQRLIERKLGWFFIAYFFWMMFTLVYSSNRELGWLDTGQKLTFLLFPFILLSNTKIKCRHIRGVVRMFYWTLYVLSIYMLVKAGYNYYTQTPTVLANDLDYFTYEKLANTVLVQPIYLALYMVFAFFGVWWDYFLQPKVSLTKAGRGMAFIWLFHFFMMVILLSSRMELLVLLFLTTVLLFWNEFKKEKRNWGLAAFKILAIGSFTIILIGMIPVNKARYQEMVDFEQDYTQNRWGGRAIRIQKWLNTLELIAENPMLGTGVGDMQNELQKVYKRNNFEIAYRYAFNPHNQYLQTWATVGLIGLFFLLGILAFSLRNALNSKNELYVLLVFILAFSMITESMLERQKGVVFFSFFLLLFAAYYHNSKLKQDSN